MPTLLPRLLVTGFEPFDGDVVNPSWEVARVLHGQALGGLQVQAACLPCSFAGALPALHAALQQHRPRLVLALGLAAGRGELSIERVAINLADARIADNAGARPVDEPVVPGAPVAYFTTLPIKAMVAAVQAAGLPAGVSQTAGTFVCNQVFFGLMHHLQARRGAARPRGGFMHLPALPEQAARRAPGTPGLALAPQVEGTRVALAAALAHAGADLRLAGGSES